MSDLDSDMNDPLYGEEKRRRAQEMLKQIEGRFLPMENADKELPWIGSKEIPWHQKDKKKIRSVNTFFNFEKKEEF